MNEVIEKQADGTWIIKSAPAAPKAELKQEANLEMSAGGFLAGIVNAEPLGVPVGAALVGAALTIAIDRLVIAKLDKTGKWGPWANLAAAFAVKKFGTKFLGNKAADVTALFLSYEAVADWVTLAINKVLPPTATTQQLQSSTMNQGVLAQANRLVGDYYARAEGR